MREVICTTSTLFTYAAINGRLCTPHRDLYIDHRCESTASQTELHLVIKTQYSACSTSLRVPNKSENPPRSRTARINRGAD